MQMPQIPGCQWLGRLDPQAPAVLVAVAKARDELARLLGEDVRDDISVSVTAHEQGTLVQARWYPVPA